MNRVLRNRRILIVLLTIGTAAFAAYVATVLGVSPLLTLLIATLVVAGGAPFYLFAGFDEREWPRPSLSLRRGVRREVSMLSWSIARDDGATSKRTSERLRRIAAARLSRIGIDLDNPDDAGRARAALGNTAYTVITVPGPRSPEILLHTTDAIAAIGSDNPSPSTRRSS